jgi:hypothetical protein
MTCQCKARYRCDFAKYCALQTKHGQLKRESENLEGYLSRFARDVEFRRHVVRERLGYADSGEFVYIFEG